MKNMFATSLQWFARSSLIVSLGLGVFYGCSSNHPSVQAEESGIPGFRFEEYTIAQLQTGYENGDFSVIDVVKAYLDRIELVDQRGPELNAIIQINPDALQIARDLDLDLKNGENLPPLFGVPILLKDNIDTHDKMPTTAGSRAMRDSKPLQDSWVADKLRKAGAVILGKSSLSEWANFRGQLSSSGWSGLNGQTKNPYVLDRNPCGSSSGSGVAVSANLCMLAIGTETNGSIVCPSTANGIVGIKPTVGLISRSGIIPISYTQDTAGPMARTLTDAVICLGTLVGVDESDAKTASSTGNSYTDYTPFLKDDALEGKRIGLFTQPYGDHYKVAGLVDEAVEYLKSQGVEIIELDKLFDAEAHDASFEVMLYEYKDGLNKYFASLGQDTPIKNLEELIEFNANDSIELSIFDQEYLLMAQDKGDLQSPAYLEALETMLRLTQEEGIDRVMDEYNLDAIMAPTGSPAWKTDHVNGDAYILGSSSPAAMSGYPNITVPMGFIQDLPVGISFFGRSWSEPALIEIAYSYEQGTQHRRPPIFIKN